MNFTTGQQLFGGQIVVVSVAPTGAVTFEFAQLGEDPAQPYRVTYDPNVTLAVIAAAYDQAKAALGL